MEIEIEIEDMPGRICRNSHEKGKITPELGHFGPF